VARSEDDHTLSAKASKRYATATITENSRSSFFYGFAARWFAVRFNETLEGKAQPRCVFKAHTATRIAKTRGCSKAAAALAPKKRVIE
jgi:hypothetical protein